MKPLTKSQVNKAGKVLRGTSSPDYVTFERAYGVLLQFRAAHQEPLAKATMGLRSIVKTEKCQKVEVSQRLKRVPTILNKLQREPTMQLANMQDIGGCRAVLADIEELRRVQRRLKRNRPPIRENDYITNPRSSGYRGVHVIVWYEERNGIQRNIEVQLRTPVMHEWAIAVERLGGRLQADLKGEQGPTPVLEWLAAISEATAFEEAGQPVDTPLVDRIELLRRDALPFLEDLRMRGAQ